MQYCWQKPQEKLIVGLHTREICYLVDKAFEDLRNGESTYLLIKVHFRAGKSDIVSRYLPPHFLGEFPDKDVMVVSYNQSLTEDFSKFSRNIIRSGYFEELYPHKKLKGGVQSWGFENHIGVVTESGITSGITGKGYTLGICDDYLSGRAEAESETVRNSLWEHFTNDFLTRRADKSITIVLATPWHVDDIIGRIERKINPRCKEYDPDFPKFKVVSFPAMNGKVKIHVKDKEKYKDNLYHEEETTYKYLFPERYDEGWYKSQFASLGEYASSSLLQCNPQLKGGNLIETDKIVFHRDLSDFPKTRYYRVWDLAHTAKQTIKDDPDYTSGTLLTYVKKDGKWHLWIKNVARIRGKAPERDRFIRQVTEQDGGGVTIVVENSIDSKDAIANLKDILKGVRKVMSINLKMDKIARVNYIEPIFESGNVHVYMDKWNNEWLNELKEFPSSKHDDQIDNLTAGYQLCCKESSKISTSRVVGI